MGVLKARVKKCNFVTITGAIVSFRLNGDGAGWFEIMEEAEETRPTAEWKGVLNSEQGTPSIAAEEALRSLGTYVLSGPAIAENHAIRFRLSYEENELLEGAYPHLETSKKRRLLRRGYASSSTNTLIPSSHYFASTHAEREGGGGEAPRPLIMVASLVKLLSFQKDMKFLVSCHFLLRIMRGGIGIITPIAFFDCMVILPYWDDSLHHFTFCLRSGEPVRAVFKLLKYFIIRHLSFTSWTSAS